MEIHGAASRQQQQHHGGVKVKFIETQFVSSDEASFKAVVQRLTGQSASSPPAAPMPNRPRARAAVTAYPASHFGVPGGGRDLMMTMATPVKQEAGAQAAAAAARLEDLYELCDFGDLLYTGGARRVDGGAGYLFPY